ncbi:hypothetical protein [Streptomyces mexicanus]|uniref:Uncharacterized protein n=1 Tax=Streptomyces mexicanus TaxID=178566 RepID=A0A7X1I7M3_9ACTN|nr:hypothetical protein [Streptomyces mexicanus]MBC2869795.1 hypothetical protein [Streptomyces mexicanus]
MSDMWTPLSTRQGTGGVLRHDVPPALSTALRQWIDGAVRESSRLADRVLLRCDLYRDTEHGPEVDDAEFLAWYTPDERLLDVVDAILNLLPGAGVPVQLPAGQKLGMLEAMAGGFANVAFMKHRRPLQELLDDGRSAYTISPNGRALVHRVDPTVTALLNTAARAAGQPDRGSASEHLRRAYTAAYALHPEPGRAYSEAIKAVECAAHATLEPNNTKATLGTMLRELRQHPGQWDVALAGKTGVEGEATITTMLSLLWTGQTSRHGGQQPTREETLAEARMAVDLAVSLVRWFADGTVRRRCP